MIDVELAFRLHHDLGKAIVLSQRWLAETASEMDRWQAIQDDVLRTRRGPSGEVSAVEIWQLLVEENAGILSEKEGQKLQECMSRIAVLMEQLCGDFDVELMNELQRLCQTVYETCLSLKRSRQARDGEF